MKLERKWRSWSGNKGVDDSNELLMKFLQFGNLLGTFIFLISNLAMNPLD